MSQNQSQSFVTGPEMLADNLAFLQWCEAGRKILHTGALELGISASELEARLQRVSGGLLVGGLTSRYRAQMVARPVQLASESLIIASRYLITASNRFTAAYEPELTQAGFNAARSTGPTMKFKAN